MIFDALQMYDLAFSFVIFPKVKGFLNVDPPIISHTSVHFGLQSEEHVTGNRVVPKSTV